MKVLLPVKNNSTGKNKIAEGFHNIDYLCIWDSDSETKEWISAKEISETPGGLNSGLVKNEIYSIISMNVTPMVLQMFNRNGINVLKAQSFDVAQNIRLFRLNQLKKFTDQESRLVISCDSSSCSSCNSTCN